jgi:hypothetical protein
MLMRPSMRAVLVVLAAASVARAAEGPTQTFADLAKEPTFQSACANWKPFYGQCVVLGPKNSRSKFVSMMAGSVQTVYVSEVWGHCPLLPSLKPLADRVAESVHVIVGSGAKPDFRVPYRTDLTQRLYRDCLPMVVTAWEDANKLQYEQTAFARLLGDRLEVASGEENSAAFIRVRVHNPTAAAQPAHLWLAVCNSSNGQGRAVPTYEYREPLFFGGDRITTQRGQVRLLWKGIAGATVSHQLRSKLPTVEEWGVKTPVPGHEPIKAFDKFFPSAWQPAAGKLTEPAGLGVRFPESRWLKGISMLSPGADFPAPDGFDVQYLRGKEWVSTPFTLHGKTLDELKKNPELVKQFGGLWACWFAPVRADGVRIMVRKMPEGKACPVIAAFDYQYSLDCDPQKNTGRWIDTGNGDPLVNYVHFAFEIPAGAQKDLVVKVPFLPVDGPEAAWLEKQDFDAQAKVVADFWRAEIDRGAQFKLPEKIVQDVWDLNIPHMLASADKDPTNGLLFLRCSVGWYDAIWGNLAGAEIMGLDLRGYHKDAEQHLEIFLKWQGTSTPPGNFKSKEGFLSSADAYTWVRWTSNHGWLLWALSDHYRLSGDRPWLDRVLPNLLAACDWIQRERARTMKNAADGTRPPEWGLLPPGVTGDGAPPCYSYTTDAYTWAGLNAAAAALREIGHPRAAEITAAVDEYRQCILRSAAWAAEHTKPYRLTSGKTVPLVPIDLYNTWKISNENQHPWYLDVGPLHLVDCGVVDARSKLADQMIVVAEDHWLKNGLALDEPWYAPQRAVYLGRDQINRFLDVYYNELAEGMDRQVHSPVEGHAGVQNLPWADGEHVRFVRMMLIQEDGDGLMLCRAAPRAWLEQGKTIAFTGAPTYFGEVSLKVQSDVVHDRITAQVTPPVRKAVPVKLRIRHPQAKPIKTVRLNGQEAKDFSGEWITIPAGSKPSSLEVLY